MSVFPLNIPEKTNTPALLAFFQQFGLDKYLSAEEINKITEALTELKEASANVSIVNTIFVNNGFEKADQLFTAFANSEWNINGINYTNPADQVITIPLCATGKVRTDRIVLDTNNNFVRVPGVEVDENPVAEAKPVNTLDYTFIPVNDAEVGDPSSPVIGNIYQQKQFDYLQTYTGTGTDVVIPLNTTGRSHIQLKGTMTSVAGLSFADLVANPVNAEYPHYGKRYLFFNDSGHDIVLKHLAATEDIFFTFKEETDLVFPNGEFLEFFNGGSNVFVNVFRSWQDINSISGLPEILDLKADLVSGKVPSSQLPYYVDDVLEFANLAAFPVTGEASKIYLALDNNLTYRWSGSTYVDLNFSKLNKVSTVDVEKVYVKNADGTQGMKPTSELGGKRVQIISDCSSWQLNQNLFFVTTESVNGVGWNSGNTLKSSQPGATSNAISLITNAFVIPIGISAYNSNLKKLVLEARHSYYRPNDRFLIGYYQKNSASPLTHINPTIIYDNIVPYGETSDGTYVVLNINSNILIPENAMIVYAIASNDATAVASVNKFYCLTTQIILEEK